MLVCCFNNLLNLHRQLLKIFVPLNSFQIYNINNSIFIIFQLSKELKYDYSNFMGYVSMVMQLFMSSLLLMMMIKAI